MTRKALPKYVYADRGYFRFIRRSRRQSVMMKEAPGTSEFWDHYNLLLKGRPTIPAKRNFEALVLSYYDSEAFAKRKPRTKKDYKTYMDHIRKIWGDKDPAKIQPHHIYTLQKANAANYRKANYLVQVLVILMNHARLIGFIKNEHGNPARGIPLIKQEGDGWEPWPDEMRIEFESKASPRARLVYELCIGLGQRISDTIEIEWKHIEAGAWDLNQGKTDNPLLVPLTDRLANYLKPIKPKVGTVLKNCNGSPATYRSVSDEMRKVKAELTFKNATEFKTHGLRKNATIELYSAGCDDEMVKAVTGHSGIEMLQKYGGQVRQRVLAERAQGARNRKEQEQNKS